MVWHGQCIAMGRLRGVWLPPRPLRVGFFFGVRAEAGRLRMRRDGFAMLRAVMPPHHVFSSAPRARGFALLVLLASLSCSDEPASNAPAAPTLDPGELCDDTSSPAGLTFDPPSVVLAPGASRPVRLVVEPDACSLKHA